MAATVSTRAASRWRLPELDPSATARIAQTLLCPEPMARLLATRGITDPHSFLEPTLADLLDPALLLGMPAAVARIQLAVTRGEPILIYGDYDVDGTTATVLLKTAIERIAPTDKPAQVSYHVPHRIREGYGMQGVRLAEAAAAGVRLVISVDTGIRAFAAATEARSLGLDLIVTDHHLPDGAEGMPDAVAVVNPAQPGCTYPNKHLCGAGVAFKLAHALLTAQATTEAQRLSLATVILPSFLKLVAIATIADSVELTGENRAIVWLGLRQLANPVQPGLRALMRAAELPLDKAPTAQEVGFRIAPRINAAGRMDIASDVVELFLTRDADRALFLAQKLDSLNQARRDSEAKALESIEIQLLSLRHATDGYANECIVLDHPEWHRGVIGILASRVVDRTRRPALVIATEDGEAYGSGRSVEGYHLVDALTHANTVTPVPLFSRFGGHAYAVGFSLPADRLTLLRERIGDHSRSILTLEMVTPSLRADLELTPADLTLDLLRWVERCAPFGMGNPEPVFIVRRLALAAEPRLLKEKHLALQLALGAGLPQIRAVAWARAGQIPWPERIAESDLHAGTVVDILFRLRENTHPTYGGLELDLIDFTRSSDPSVECL
jgi:single-stranded-DNA-specific exonuclease